MSDLIRISLIHATKIAIDPIVTALDSQWPEVENVSLLDEALSIDRSKNTNLSDDLHGRIVALARYAEGLGSAGILYTCSAFGEAIEDAARTSPLPVLKPNEAMFEKAFTHGDQVVMLYTFPAAVAGMEQEFRDEAQKRNSSASIRSVFAKGAREALEQGDAETHNRIIAETAAQVTGADALLLAHFSMAGAANATRASTDLPVLTSP